MVLTMIHGMSDSPQDSVETAFQYDLLCQFIKECIDEMLAGEPDPEAQFMKSSRSLNLILNQS